MDIWAINIAIAYEGDSNEMYFISLEEAEKALEFILKYRDTEWWDEMMEEYPGEKQSIDTCEQITIKKISVENKFTKEYFEAVSFNLCTFKDEVFKVKWD